MRTVLVVAAEQHIQNDLYALIFERRKGQYQVLKVGSVEDAVYLYDSGDIDAVLFMADLEGRVRVQKEEKENSGQVREVPVYGKEDFETGSEAAKYVQILIQRFYHRDYTAKQYASWINISLPYLCRVFKKRTGYTIGNYIWKVRMEHAADYLTRSNTDVHDVAKRVGYRNFSYFSRRFHDFYHVSPRNYRAVHRQ